MVHVWRELYNSEYVSKATDWQGNSIVRIDMFKMTLKLQ